ncbi:hypothetical protein MKZ17_07915 [Solibacillus sp. FSL R7-0682]|uniref:hypothetical protein n=1 Tax=Solibacillus sp. FSL R7-0682 TaxID=2921690 RepID=UPI0030FCA36F
MSIITGIKFMSLEFDFGNSGNIDAQVFVEIDSDGERQTIEHKLQLHEVSFLDFLTKEQVNNELQIDGNFSSLSQTLRKFITYKVASDLGFEVAGINFTPAEPLRNRIESLQTSQAEQDTIIMKLLLGGA